LKNVEVKKYIDKLLEDKAKEHNITHQQLIEDLTEIKNRCMQAKPVTFMGKHIKDENGNNLWKFDAKGATKAIELIGRHTGFFLEDNKQKQPIVNPVQNTYVTPNECKDAIQHIKDYIKND
jgi:phage terminase small subunit